MTGALPAWIEREDLDPVAAAFARLLFCRARTQTGADVADALARIGALLCLERARGHACVMPQDWCSEELPLESPGEAAGRPPRLPDAIGWERALRIPVLVGNGDGISVLVRREDASVALFRDDAAERRLARAFVEMLTDPGGVLALDEPARASFHALFPEAIASGQALAAAAAMRSRLCVITGGPGTGKTTAVVRVLAWMLSTRPHLRIAVCAPTGKAAARLKDSIEQQRHGLPVTPAVRAALAVDVVTVHRLLGYRPGAERFTRGPHHPLDADVVVVDEASMLDLGLVDALVQSLPPNARLVLLGDRDQLASVDAGSVLADLVANRRVGSDARSADFARWADGLFLGDCAIDRTADAWSDALVELRHNFRFAEQPEIAELADALREGDAEAALSVLDDPARTQVVRVEPPARKDALAPLLHPLLEPLGEQACEDVPGRLDRIERGMRVLTAVRRGPWGVEGLNALAERTLRARGWNLRETWYEGRPVLVLRNAPELGLANGDLGVIARIAGTDAEDRMVFAVRGTEPRSWQAIPPAQLPEHETAWSMTVHKSQGSEFERVVLVLPPGRHPLLSRELLYTGVTRARDRVTVVASAATVRAAVEQVERRRSGLGARLTEVFRARFH